MATVATPTPGSTGVGTEVKAFFVKIGRAVEAIGAKTLKIIAGIQKNDAAVISALNATLAAIFPQAVIPAEVAEKIFQASLVATTAVANALVDAGLNPSLDEAAAVAVAGVIHGTGASVAGATNPSSTAG